MNIYSMGFIFHGKSFDEATKSYEVIISEEGKHSPVE